MTSVLARSFVAESQTRTRGIQVQKMTLLFVTGLRIISCVLGCSETTMLEAVFVTHLGICTTMDQYRYALEFQHVQEFVFSVYKSMLCTEDAVFKLLFHTLL